MAHHLATAEPRDRRAGTQASPRQRPSPPERRRRLRTLVVLILVVAAVATLVSAMLRRTGGASPQAEAYGPSVPASGVWLGVQVVPGSTGSTQQTLAALETRVGRRFDVVYQQLGWDEPLERVSALETGQPARIPLLGWKPLRTDGSIVPWPSIANGKEDARLTAMAIRLSALPRRVYLAFANQPEADVGGRYGTAGDYALAYRHVHDLFAKLGVTNVVWVWSVTSASKWASLRTRLYPGDAYVDWLAVDVGDSRCGLGAAGESLADVTEPFHRWATTRHPGKPAMVTGYGGIPDPAAAWPQADWLAADLSVVRARRPEIKAVVYSAVPRRDACGRGMATSFVPPTPLPATGQATGGGNATTASARACQARDRSKVTRVDGTLPTYRIGSVADGRTYDLRRATIVGYPATNRYPLLFGKQGPGDATCVLGGRVVGQQSRAFSWQVMKQDLDGDGLNFRSQGGIVDGTWIDNVEDGIATTGGDPDGVTISNVYLTYIRDDCIENDWFVSVSVQDSLLDGCFNGVSERPGRNVSPPPPPSGEALTLDGILMRLRPMPYDRTRALCAHNAADGLGSSGFFKWSRYANRLVVRNTVLLAERGSVNCGTSMNFPGDGVYQNVTLVWLGGGSYPGRLPPSGVTVTTDRQIWDQARARWLTRHGYPTTGDPVASP
jgi:hypothetical protein